MIKETTDQEGNWFGVEQRQVLCVDMNSGASIWRSVADVFGSSNVRVPPHPRSFPSTRVVTHPSERTAP